MPTIDVEKLLLDACWQQQDQTIRKALTTGTIDVHSEFAGRLLHEACRWNRVEVARDLVRAGVAVDAPGQMQATPLGLAVRYRAHSLIEMLLDVGANVNAVDRFGVSVLAMAAAAIDGDPGVTVPQLLGRGARVNVPNGHGETELHRAAVRGDATAVDALLAHGADPTLLNQKRETAVELALAWGQQDAARRLLDWCRDRDLLSLMRDELVASAARGACLPLVEELLTPQTRLDRPGATGFLPLHDAASHGDLDTLRRLLDAGADPNATTRQGDTALAIATRSHHLDAVTALLSAGANPDLVSASHDVPPVGIAIDQGLPDIARALAARMSEGARERWPAAVACARLMQSANLGDVAVAREVLAPSADLPQAQVQRAFVLAIDREHAEVARAIAAAALDPRGVIADGPPVLAHAARARYVDPELIQLLLARGADPNVPAPGGWWPLHAVAGRGGAICHDYERPVEYRGAQQRDLERVVELLIDAGARLDTKDWNGLTARQLAEQSGTPAMVRRLSRARP